jgi:chromate reductase
MTEPLNVFALSGSLRKDSFNSAALRACQALAPNGMTIDIYDRLRDLPHYDEDLRTAGHPPVVEDLRRRVREADALLIATPEYNHSVPGVLKNAIDWASRPPEVPLTRKSVAIFGASSGMLGTIRAQYHLRDIMVFFDALVVNKPEVFIGAAQTKFGPDGTLRDDSTAAILRTLLEQLQKQTLAARTRTLEAA